MPILELAGLTKRYGRRLVLAGADATLGEREFVVVTGANGSGKTTLLRLMATLARPSQGKVRWFGPGGTAVDRPEEVRRFLGYCAHEPLLWDDLTARENLTFVLRLHGHEDPPGEASNALQEWGLAGRANDRAGQLSRGLRQRLALARAVATRPKALFLDEPTTGLDAEGERILLQRLGALRGRALVVIATHQPDLFRPLADRMLELHDRRLRDWGRGT